jgi:DNA-binding CsgD family transcriptional regulator
MIEDLELEATDVRAALRLVAEVAAVPGNLACRRRHLLTGLARLAGADVWMWAEGWVGDEGQVVPRLLQDGGWSHEEQRRIGLGALAAPERLWAERRIEPRPGGPPRTHMRRELVPDDRWYGSTFFQRWRAPADLDDFVVSIRRPEKNTFSRFGLHRRIGREPFGPRERNLVEFLSAEVDWLHRAEAPDIASPLLDSLSGRQREVLHKLLAGESRKEIASCLALSLHTVNEHVRLLYARLGVGNRGELLARFLRGG